MPLKQLTMVPTGMAASSPLLTTLPTEAARITVLSPTQGMYWAWSDILIVGLAAGVRDTCAHMYNIGAL